MTERIPTQILLPAHWPDRVAFEVRERSFTWAHVVRAAAVRGDLQASFDTTRRALSRERQAALDGREADAEAVETAMNDFRYARALETAEETEQWLAGYGLEPDDFAAHFLRRHWDDLGESPGPEPAAEPGMMARAWAADLVLSGDFARLARRLAREMMASPTDAADPEGDSLREDLQHRLGLYASGFESWCLGWNLDRQALHSILTAQQRLRRMEQQLLSPGRRSAALAGLRHSLVRVRLLVTEFDSAAAAHEAYLCVAADGMSLEAVALEAGFPVRTESGLVHRFPESWRSPLVRAVPGRTLSPLADGERHWVCRVLQQEEPALEDPEVAAAVDAAILERHFAEREISEVRWHLPREVPP